MFDQRRILLRHLVHLTHGLGNLFYPGTLFAAGAGDFGDQLGYFMEAADDLVHGVAGIADQLGAAIDLGHGLGNQLLDFLGGGRRALSQIADLGGNDGETASLLAGPGCLDRRVEREDVGLEGDAVDHADNVGDFLRAVLDAVHGGDHLLHHLPAAGGNLVGILRQMIGLARVLGILLDCGVELFHRA